jgi:hypothetical protein
MDCMLSSLRVATVIKVLSHDERQQLGHTASTCAQTSESVVVQNNVGRGLV